MMRIAGGFAAAAFAALVGLESTISPPAPFTARTQLTQATAAAKKWRPDAVLTHVSSLTVNPDGSAKSWIYTFYAPKTQKSLTITVAPGAALDTLEVQNTSMQPIGEPFLDSDKAMQEAKQHDLKGNSPSMGLVVMGFTGSAVWAVNGGFSEGDVSVMVDGTTGAFIRRQVISYK